MSEQSKTLTPRLIVQMALFIIVVPFLPLLITWRWDWWAGWAYAAIGILGFVASRALAARRHPDLLAERARFTEHEDAAPFLLDALWAFAPMLLLTAALVIRTKLEDETLQEQLPGYRAYAQRVRYRLAPGVW